MPQRRWNENGYFHNNYLLPSVKDANSRPAMPGRGDLPARMPLRAALCRLGQDIALGKRASLHGGKSEPCRTHDGGSAAKVGVRLRGSAAGTRGSGRMATHIVSPPCRHVGMRLRLQRVELHAALLLLVGVELAGQDAGILVPLADANAAAASGERAHQSVLAHEAPLHIAVGDGGHWIVRHLEGYAPGLLTISQLLAAWSRMMSE